MDTSIVTTLISTGGAVIAGVFGMFYTSSQVGRRIDEIGKRIDDLRQDVRDLRMEFNAFRETVNGKFRDLDLEIARLMDKSQGT